MAATIILLAVAAALACLACLAAALRPRGRGIYRCQTCGSRLATIPELETHAHGCAPTFRDACNLTWAGHTCIQPEGHDSEHRCGCDMGWSLPASDDEW